MSELNHEGPEWLLLSYSGFFIVNLEHDHNWVTMIKLKQLGKVNVCIYVYMYINICEN